MNREERGRWYRRAAWRRTRAVVLARDLHACVRCGASGDGLNVDHILPAEHWPGLIYDVANLQTLCTACNADKQREEQRLVYRLQGMTPAEREREIERFRRQNRRRQRYAKKLIGGGGVAK